MITKKFFYKQQINRDPKILGYLFLILTRDVNLIFSFLDFYAEFQN
jgi:hypothetical protein